jgi:RNA polymerase sigma factor (sigma-70 family)
MGHTIAATDAELLEASKRGEHAAFGSIVERYQDVVCAVSYSRTRDQALSEDVAQETFLAAWRQLHQLREPGRLRSWLCGIAANLAAKARKRGARETLAEIEVATQENPFDAVSDAQAERVVGEALERVPEIYRDVMVLYYREQRSIRDVARALDISEAAALQRLARGRQYLADGVTSLVEKSLRGLPRKSLVAGVVAALPMIVPSRVEASTHGGNMILKIAIAVTALGAAGTTAYVIQDRPAAKTEPTATLASAPAQTPTPTVRATTPPPQAAIAPPPPTLPGATPQNTVPAPDTEASITRDVIAKLKLEQGTSRGAPNAPVVVTVFTDMQCKFCGDALGSLDTLLDEYPSKLRIVVKQMPVHKTAKLAAEAAYAADAQGKFWQLHDLMLANQEDLSREPLLALAQQAGLDVPTFRTALDSHAYADEVAADVKAATEIEIMGTPAFVINGRKIIGNVPLANLRAAIDSALAD